MFDNCQSETGSTILAWPAFIHPVKSFEQARDVFRFYAHAVILYFNQLPIDGMGLERYGGFAAQFLVVDGILNEIVNGLVRREAKNVGVDVNNPEEDLGRPEMRVGIIPGGKPI